MTEKAAKVYIAGPMNSVGGNFNFPLFDYVSQRLKECGCEIFNPADHARKTIGTLEEIQKLPKKEMARYRKTMLRYEINWIIDNADFVLMLPGWERSLGASAERAVALALDIPVRNAPDVTTPIDSWAKKNELTISKTEE